MAAHGTRLFSIACVLGASLALTACSGAGNQDLFEPSGSSDTSSTLPAPTTTAPPPDSPDVETPDAGTTPAPTPGAAPPPGPDDCTPEKEPNNDVTKATPFTSRFCGKIDSATDADHGSFVVPTKATTMTWKTSEDGGKVTVRFAGMSLPGGNEGDEMRVFPGQTYTVQIRNAQSSGASGASGASGGGKPTYELSLSFK